MTGWGFVALSAAFWLGVLVTLLLVALSMAVADRSERHDQAARRRWIEHGDNL